MSVANYYSIGLWESYRVAMKNFKYNFLSVSHVFITARKNKTELSANKSYVYIFMRMTVQHKMYIG